MIKTGLNNTGFLNRETSREKHSKTADLGK